MLSCHTLTNKIGSDYIDGQLTWRQRLAVAFHLLLCVNCRRFIRQLKQIRGVLLHCPKLAEQDVMAQAGHPPRPDDYLHRLAHQLHAEYRRQNESK